MNSFLDAIASSNQFVRKVYGFDQCNKPNAECCWSCIDEAWVETDASFRSRIQQYMQKANTMATKTIDLQPVDSSQISAIGYDAETKTLAIQFKAKQGTGSVYHYANITQAAFDAFRTAESLGAHFGKCIKPYPDLFPYVKVKDAAAA